MTQQTLNINKKPHDGNWIGEKYYHHSKQQKIVAELLLNQYLFKETDCVLDVGCGDGKITNEIYQKRIPQGNILGVDPSESMIEFANASFSSAQVQFVKGKASELSYENQFDVITSFSCLHWEPKQQEALECFKRALKPGGVILLAIPGPDPILRQSLEIICNSEKWGSFFQHFQSSGRIWKPNEYAKLLLDTDFIIRKIELVDRPYRFDDEGSYKNFIDAMLPHMTCIPTKEHAEFLNDLVTIVKEKGHLDERGRIKFDVKVLEIIAHTPNFRVY